jgi:hypothetical protein
METRTRRNGEAMGGMFATQTSDVRNVRINLIWDTALSGNGKKSNSHSTRLKPCFNTELENQNTCRSRVTLNVRGFILTETRGTKPQDLRKPPKQEIPSGNSDTKKSSGFS